MLSDAKIVRLDRSTSQAAGVTCLSSNPEDCGCELPTQSVHQYYIEPDLGLTVGVRTTNTLNNVSTTYVGDAFFLILEGQVDLIDSQGIETAIHSGETFCVGDKSNTTWKHNGVLRKLFIKFEPDETAGPSIPNGGQGVHFFDQETLSSSLTPIGVSFPFEFEKKRPKQRDATAFVNDTGNMYAGM